MAREGEAASVFETTPTPPYSAPAKAASTGTRDAPAHAAAHGVALQRAA